MKNLKRLASVLAGATLMAALGAFLWSENSEHRVRAELHLLNTLGAGLTSTLGDGGHIPETWRELTNHAVWQKVIDVCVHNHLPPVEQTYTLLYHKVSYTERPAGDLFLVRLKATSRPYAGRGRWALVATSNQVFRVWIPEDKVGDILAETNHLQPANKTRDGEAP